MAQTGIRTRLASLIGPRGPKGDDGAPGGLGPQGDPGPQGPQGLHGLDAVPTGEGIANHLTVDGPARTALNAASVGTVIEGRGDEYIDLAAFGGTPLPDASGAGADSTDALEAAIAYAKSARSSAFGDASRRIHLNGWYKISRDIKLDWTGVEITGEGGNSGILALNCGVIVDGTNGTKMRQALRNLRIRRVTTAGREHGTALLIEGGGANSGNYPCRWGLENIECESPVNPNGTAPEQSVALKIRGTFLATNIGVYCRNAHRGLVIENDNVAGTLAANAVTFIGGEIQAVDYLGSITGSIGVSFYGSAWEGATQGGMDVDDTVGFTAHGMYFEAVAGYDVRIGETSSASGIEITGFTSPGALAADPAKMAVKRSVILRRGRGVSVGPLYASGYDIPPVLVDEASVGTVSGSAENVVSSRGSVAPVQVAAGRDWNIPVEPMPTRPGAPSAEVAYPPGVPAGTTVLDTVNNRMYVRVGGGWRYAALA